jgi:hypothetical protein
VHANLLDAACKHCGLDLAQRFERG